MIYFVSSLLTKMQVYIYIVGVGYEGLRVE